MAGEADEQRRGRKRDRRSVSSDASSSSIGSESDSSTSSSSSSSSEEERRSRHSRSRSRKRNEREEQRSERGEKRNERGEKRNERGEKRSEREEKRSKREERKRKEKKRKLKESSKEKRKAEKKKRRERAMRGPVTSSWGKYGLIKEIDMWSKRPEFSAWLHEVKKVNLETLPAWEERQMFKDYMEDYNTGTLPSKKYYNIDKYYHRKMVKRRLKAVGPTERTVFNDEEQRRQEQKRERESQKAAEIVNLKRSMMGSGVAQAMREQQQLREDMQYQFRLGNLEAANAIQKRLDPQVE